MNNEQTAPSSSSSLQPPASSLLPSRSFSDFMEEALYHPEHGYYGSGRASIGKKGDFFTNVSVGKIYAHILSLFFEEVWKRLEKPTLFFIVEQGAHNGSLAHDILTALGQEERSAFTKSVYNSIVEPLSSHRELQKQTLVEWKNVSWVTTNQEIPFFEGVHFSNELLDAFPVDLLVWDGSNWLEKRVTTKPDQSFSWITTPIKNKELLNIAAHLPTNLAPGFHWEVRLGVKPWVHEISSRMKCGVLLIADYGYAGSDRFAPYRAEGSIACYQNHQRYDNPLEEAGKRDITTHVDFTDVAEAAQLEAFDLLGYTDQHHFLIGASEQWLRSFEGKTMNADNQRDLRLLQTLLHPETMGRQFKFLGLGKGMPEIKIPTALPLSGFRYQRPGANGLIALIS